MPQWILPCMVFNNATSLPLLLLQSLGKSGTLDPLAKGGSVDALLSRGNVYLLINALVCNLTRFSFGPYLMTSSDSHPWSHSESPHTTSKIAETQSYPTIEPYPEESSPLLSRSKEVTISVWKRITSYLNPPMAGGIAAVVTGSIPPFHRWLYGDDAPLTPFTQSVQNIGDLYTVLQMFVLGAHLKSKKGSPPPIFPLAYLFVFRFAIMPVISTSVIYGVRKWLGDRILLDPILDFTMAIAPVGPPALTLAALVEMADTDEGTDSAVAQTIVLSYAFTPLIGASVSGVLTVVKRLY